MHNASAHRIRIAVLAATVCGITACASPGLEGHPQRVEPRSRGDNNQSQLQLLNRVTWGASPASAQQIAGVGNERFIEQQLHPASASLPGEIQLQIDAMTISQRPLADLVFDLEQRRRESDAIADPEQKKAAQQAYQQELNRIAREVANRSLLRALYSSNQLQEQMTWFWMNHFNVHQYKSNVRLLLGDYE